MERQEDRKLFTPRVSVSDPVPKDPEISGTKEHRSSLRPEVYLFLALGPRLD